MVRQELFHSFMQALAIHPGAVAACVDDEEQPAVGIAAQALTFDGSVTSSTGDPQLADVNPSPPAANPADSSAVMALEVEIRGPVRT